MDISNFSDDLLELRIKFLQRKLSHIKALSYSDQEIDKIDYQLELAIKEYRRRCYL